MKKGTDRKLIGLRVAASLLLTFAACMFLLESGRVQTALVRRMISSLKNEHLDISVGSVRVVPFSAAIIEDILATDPDPYLGDPFGRGYSHTDTLLCARRISATFTLKGLLSKDHLRLGRVRIDDCSYFLQVEPCDSDRRIGLGTLGRCFNLPAPSDTIIRMGDIFEIKKLEMNNFHFTMRTFATPKDPYIGSGVNWGFIDATASRIRAHGIGILDDRFRAHLDYCAFSEVNGPTGTIEDAQVRVGLGNTTVTDALYTDAESRLLIKECRLNYTSTYAFEDFPDSVRLDLTLGDSHLTLGTVSSFLGGLDGIPLGFDIDHAVFTGYVNDLSLLDIKATEDSGILIDGMKCNVRNIFKNEPVGFHFTPDRIRFTTAQVENVIDRVAGKSPELSAYAAGEMIDLGFDAEGTFDDFTLDAQATVDGGRLKAGIDFRKHPQEKGSSIAGKLFLDELDLGRILGISKIGRTSLCLDADAILGDEQKIRVQKLDISKLTALDYPYTGISGNGIFNGRRFDGKIISRDPNLNFIFQGIFDFAESRSDKIYKFFATVAYANLKALNLDHMHPVSELSTGVVSANLRSMPENSALVGEVSLADIRFTDNIGVHDIGDLKITSQITSSAHRLQLVSSFAEGGYVGNASFSEIAGSILSASVMRELPSALPNFPGKTRMQEGAAFDLNLNIHDSYDLMSLIQPGLYIADGTGIKASMDSSGFIVSTIDSPRIAIGENFIRNLHFRFDNSGDNLKATLRGDEAKAGPYQLLGTNIDATADTDSIAVTAAYSVKESEDFGKIALLARMERDSRDSLTVYLSDEGSHLLIDGRGWTSSPWNIRFSNNCTVIDDFSLTSGDQNISAYGVISTEKTGRFDIGIKDLDLDALSTILGPEISIGGIFNADARILSPRKGISGVSADLSARSLTINGNHTGNITGKAFFPDEETLSLSLKGIDPNGRNGLDAEAVLSLNTGGILGNAAFHDFDISPFAVLAKDYISRVDGRLRGNLNLAGTLEAPEIYCDSLEIHDASAEIPMTGMKYRMEGLVSIDRDGPLIREFTISDGIGGSARLKGRIPGTELTIDGLKVLDKRDAGDGLFGSLALDGGVTLGGESLSSIEINANISTSGEGHVNVNVGGSSDNAAAASILSFLSGNEEAIREAEQYAARLEYKELARKSSTNAAVRAAINVSPEVEIVLGLDQDGINMLTTRGSGLVNLDINTSAGGNGLSGNYDIQSGKYHLSVLGTLVNKDFTIQQGSTLRFGGDLLDTEFDIKAVHSLRASLGPLISDTTSVSTQRTVNCGISITDKLRSPELGFSIDVPDLDPTTSSLVQSELNTEDKVQKQFLGLLVTGSFIPSEQGGGVVNNTGSNILYKNLSMIMSGQLNSILQKLEIPVDLGFNYQQNEAGKDIFDVAISTQMLNNRVLVNGTIGNRQFSTRSNGEMVGDIDVQIKLDRTGNTRMNLFSHSADDYTNYLDNTQRSGIGISYQKEFKRFGDLFKKKSDKGNE